MLSLNPQGDTCFPTMSATNKIVGTPVPRKESVDKLIGRALYVDDIQREDM